VQSLLDAAMQLQQRAPAAGAGGNGDRAHMPLDEVGSLHEFPEFWVSRHGRWPEHNTTCCARGPLQPRDGHMCSIS